VALANKETLVAAGPLVRALAEESCAALLPVDSEHSAIFQALRAGGPGQLRRILLTASGGPFRSHTLSQLEHVTVTDALQHPTWKMGRKITIDSATMMNKALEIIEARWLFNLDPAQIEVLIHPQSIVHSMVEFIDGSVVAQMSPPDMRLPIQYALSYPDRWSAPAPMWDVTRPWELNFEAPAPDRFPALQLGFDVARAGGTAGVVLNAANETAVAAFLGERLAFRDIVTACRSVVDHHDFDARPDLDHLFALDAWARKELTRWIGS
jgi:1-deoxy-D-xylulose-5-phosphate reductoisomerase